MYILQLGYGGLYYSKWVGPREFAESPDAYRPPGNPRGPGSDVVGPHYPGLPWSVEFLVSAVSSKAAAGQMKNKAAAQQFIAAADQAITAFIDSDDICPPWPFPGPPPWLSIIAAEVTMVANTLQDGALRAGLMQVAGQLLDRVALNPQPLPPG